MARIQNFLVSNIKLKLVYGLIIIAIIVAGFYNFGNLQTLHITFISKFIRHGEKNQTTDGTNEVRPCIAEFFVDSFVCVCNSTYCDTIHRFEEDDIQKGSYVHYESNISGNRMRFTKGKFSRWKETGISSNWTISSFTVDTNVTYQGIIGFGGAITDSVGIVLSKATPETQEQLLRQYFGDEGLNYNLVRIPMGASDFSSHKYTYDDNGSGNSLSNFNITMEDYQYKIQILKRAQAISKASLKILTAPWTAPERMLESRIKSIERIYPIRRLKDSYYSTYSKYFIKFLDLYKKEGIQFWALSIQNEPILGLVGFFYNMSIGWTPWEAATFIQNHLGPELHSSGYGNVKLLAVDENWLLSNTYGTQVIDHARKYISGIALHSYFDFLRDPAATCRMQNVFPDLFLLNTEASVTWGPAAPQPSWINRSWENLEDYVTNMLKALNNCVQGWMDWNLFLDKEGGPNMFPIPVDAPIKIMSPNKFYKQDMWYGLAHVSHFIPQGSKRTDLKPWNNNTKSLRSIAFLTPENRVAIILLNRDNNPQDIVINVSKEDQIRLTLSSRSLHTFIYKA